MDVKDVIISQDLLIQVHSTVRKRWLDGDMFIISSMEEVAKIALEGRRALLEKDYTKLAELMNRNFDLRRLKQRNLSFLSFQILTLHKFRCYIKQLFSLVALDVLSRGCLTCFLIYLMGVII